MRRVLVVCVLVAIAATGAVVWRCRAPEPSAVAPRQRTGKVKLDVAKIRRERDARVAKAKALASRYNPQARRKPGPPSENMYLVEPACLLGTPDVCLSLVGMIADCDAKNGETCLALGQFLLDTPPRVTIAPVFFKYACDAGVREGCTRWEELMRTPPRSCAEDPPACGWNANRSGDRARKDEACALGFGETCMFLAFDEPDADLRHTYLEATCQADARGGCHMLGYMLRDDCDQGLHGYNSSQCLPPDEEGSKDALALACEAGIDDACN